MILICYGTRPEWIKIKPLLNKLKTPYKLLFTGQHNMINEKYDIKLNISNSNNRLNDILVSSLSDNSIFDDVDCVLVMGDTTTALSLAISAYHNKIKIIHLEAGLRTYDINNPYPEEFNRRTIDSISDILLCPTELNKQNLLNEKCQGKIYVVGNTVIDNLISYKTTIYNNNIVVTLHRRENHELIPSWFIKISELAQKYTEYKFILPIHPNPNVEKYKYLLEGVNVVDPLNYEDMLKLISECRMIISDSGGIQEEASFFQKRIIVCRKTTERPEILGKNGVLCPEPNKLLNTFEFIINQSNINFECPFGDGTASEKISKII